MKNKRKLLYSFGAIIPIGGVILATQACSVGKSIQNHKYKLDHKLFSRNEAISYIKSFSKSQFKKREDESERTWIIDTAAGEQSFNSPYELRKQLIQNIEEKYATVIPLNNLNSKRESENNELFANQVIPMEYNNKLNNGSYNFDTGLIDVYEGRDDYPFFGSTTSKTDAKKSWMRFHNAYLYNGIYFKNKEDLEVYLNNKIRLKDQTELDKFRRYSFNFPLVKDENGVPQNFKILTIPKNNDGTLNFESLKKIVSKQIEANSSKVISIKKSDGNFENFTIKDLDEKAKSDSLLKYFKAWNIGTDRTSSYYVIDSSVGSRGDLFGNYFSKLPYSPGQENDKSGIMAIDIKNPSWKKLSGDGGEITKLSKDLSIENKLGSLMSLIFSSITSKNQKDNIAASFIDIFTQKKLKVFIDYLNDIRLNNSNYDYLGKQFLEIDKILRQGKKYNLFYSLPILRNWLISRLIDGGAAQVDLNKVNGVFIRGATYLNIIANNLLGPLLKGTNVQIDFNKIYGFEDTSQNIYANPQTSIQEIIKSGGGVLKDAINIFLLTSSYITNNFVNNVQTWASNKKNKNEQNTISPKKIQQYKFPTDSTKMNDHDLFKNYRFSSNNLNFKRNLWDFFANIKEKYVDVNKKINDYNKSWFSKTQNIFNGFEDFVPKKETNKGDENNDYLKQISEIVIGNVDKNNSNSSTHDFKDIIKQKHEVTNGFIKKENPTINIISNSVKKVNDFVEVIQKTKLRTNLSKMTNKTVSLIKKSAGISKVLSSIKVGKKFFEVASKLKSVVGKVFKAVPYISAIFIAADIIKGIVSFFSKKYIKERFAYKATNGSTYIWNGGERVEQFLGISSKTTHGLDELKLLNPIQLTATSKLVKQYYFDGKLYDSKKEALLEAFARIKNNSSLETIRSFFTSEVSLIKNFAGYSIDKKGGKWNNDKERNKIAEALVRSALNKKNNINKIDPKKDIDNDSIYIKPMYTTSQGITFDKTKAISTIISDTLANIKPIFIFQKPKVEDNKLKILPFSLPYPSYTVGSGIIDEDETKRDVSGLQYIFNPNLDKNSMQELKKKNPNIILESSRDIINYYLNNLTQDFEVPHKKVYKLEALSKNKYSKLLDNYKQIKIFLAKSPLGKRKYFKNQASAIRWLGIEYNLRTVIPSTIFKKYIWKGFNRDQNIEFDSESSLIKYVLDKYNLGEIYA